VLLPYLKLFVLAAEGCPPEHPSAVTEQRLAKEELSPQQLPPASDQKRSIVHYESKIQGCNSRRKLISELAWRQLLPHHLDLLGAEAAKPRQEGAS